MMTVEEDEGQEDAITLAKAAPAPPPREEGETAGTGGQPGNGLGQGSDGPGGAAEGPTGDGQGPGPDGAPVWLEDVGAVRETVRAIGRQAVAETLGRTAGALEAARPETVGMPRGTGAGGAAASAAADGRGTGTGLDRLYRQAVGAARPAAPALPPERAGRTVRAEEPGSAASLAVDELDRAVRRDSRRYDGGMSIY